MEKFKEEWMEDERYPGYMFSNTGKVVSFKSDKFTEIKQFKRNSKYWSVVLWINRKSIMRGTAKLVAELFVENPYNKKHVMLKDQNPDNLKANNIVWCTKDEIESSNYDKRKEFFLKQKN